MEKEKCEICDKIVNGDSCPVPQVIFEKIGYQIPVSCVQGETEMVDVSEKVREKPFVTVGFFCHCDKKIKIALKRMK